jgi:hypothetical protein
LIGVGALLGSFAGGTECRGREENREEGQSPDTSLISDTNVEDTEVDAGEVVQSDTVVMPPCQPAPERCDGMDNDCDDRIDEGAESMCETLANASTQCVSGRCEVSCNEAYQDCDEREDNGCETRTASSRNHCGACGRACVAANAMTACQDSECQIDGCVRGFADCDRDYFNGCELSHESGTACATAENLGSHCGDSKCNFACPAQPWNTAVTRTGVTSAWFRATNRECSSCCANFSHRIRLSVPEDVDYDLFVYTSCGGRLLGSSESIFGDEEVIVTGEDNCIGGDDDFSYRVEVRYRLGASCEPWTLTLEARSVCE